MKILIYEYGQYISESKEAPIIGHRYYLDDATTGTAAQNRTIHALINAIYDWMQKTDQYQFEVYQGTYDFRLPSAKDFKDFLKYKYGQGFKHYEYADDKYQLIRVKTLAEIPGYVIDDFNGSNKKRIKGVLKSWADYTLKERKDFIDKVKHIGIIIGCDSKKFHDILDGMEKEK